MKTNQQFKNQALDALRGNWVQAVLTTLLFIVIAAVIEGPYGLFGIMNQEDMRAMLTYGDTAGLLSMYGNMLRVSGCTFLATILLLNPILVGLHNAYLLLLEGEVELPREMFRLAFKNYWHKVLGMLWVYVLISLWMLLLFIPGIIKAFSYAMTPYILEENPELDVTEAIHRSRMMMHGHKFDLFWLYLGFIGWFFLAILTGGIGFLWLSPYMEASQAAFYQEVRADYALNGGLD
ncbi:MAG: DUF975 family protein [Bacteroidales bacterium]|nr:DUF975 family protein [Bacteroidales bacterium]